MNPILSLHVLMLVGPAFGFSHQQLEKRSDRQRREFEGFYAIRLLAKVLPMTFTSHTLVSATTSHLHHRAYWPLNNHDTPSKSHSHSTKGAAPPSKYCWLLICSITEHYRRLSCATGCTPPSLFPSRYSRQAQCGPAVMRRRRIPANLPRADYLLSVSAI